VTGPAAAGPHLIAIVALLDAAAGQLPTPIRAYFGKRPDTDTTCIVVHGSPGVPSGTLGDRFADLTIDFQITCVADGPEQAQAYADAARTALLTTALTVPGRAVWPIWQSAAQPVLRDDTVQPPLWIATAQYTVKSNPA
jgi:hypothetical protein